jgi:hypothetical protein
MKTIGAAVLAVLMTISAIVAPASATDIRQEICCDSPAAND